MSKYLTKLKVGPSNITSTIGVKFNFTNMNCGNSYKEGLKHEFKTNDSTDISLLIDIIKRFKFKTIITNVTDKSFEFENTLETVQIFFFRICRYTRTKDIRKILEDTIMINKSGVTIQNAFLLAHYYNWRKVNAGQNNQYHIYPNYYNPGMDGFYDPNIRKISDKNDYLNKPFKTLADFHKYFENKNGITYNYIFNIGGNTKQGKQAERKRVFELLEEKKFKACERYLKSVFFK